MSVEQNPEQIKRSLAFIAETGTAMEMPRSHNKYLGNTFDTVASHQNHTGIIAYVITRLEGLSHEDGLQALAMGSLHDLAEIRTGDADLIAKNYTQIDEPKATHHMLHGLPFQEELAALYEQYETRETPIAKCAKDADALEQLYQEWILSHRGNQMARKWFDGDLVHRIPSLRTESAKLLALSMRDSEPDLWWWKDFTGDNLNQEHLNGKK